MRILQIGSDRSKRGVMVPGTAGALRQEAYAERFGHLDVIGFTRAGDGFQSYTAGPLTVYPTTSTARMYYVPDAVRLALSLSRPDVATAQDPFETGIAAWIVAKRFGVPLHVQVHTDFLDPEYQTHSFLNRIRVRIARFILRRASGIRVVSDRIRRSVVVSCQVPSARISVLPMYADIERITRLLPDSGMRARFEHCRAKVLVVARLESEKRVSLAIDAFARTAPEDACLIVVGEGSERAALGQQAQELGIAGKVFFEGGAEAAPYYHLADVVLVPSEYEGYGLVIVEALGMGKPVISTDVGIAREAGATIITPPALFAEALKKWFDHGPREGVLRLKMPASFDEYVKAYCEDVARLTK